jgi:uncharacterized membrane protein YdbT with pleckstrin-like domain
VIIADSFNDGFDAVWQGLGYVAGGIVAVLVILWIISIFIDLW